MKFYYLNLLNYNYCTRNAIMELETPNLTIYSRKKSPHHLSTKTKNIKLNIILGVCNVSNIKDLKKKIFENNKNT